MSINKNIKNILYPATIVIFTVVSMVLALFINKFLLHFQQEDYLTFHFFIHPMTSDSFTGILDILWISLIASRKKDQKQNILLYVLPLLVIGLTMGIAMAILHIQ